MKYLLPFIAIAATTTTKAAATATAAANATTAKTAAAAATGYRIDGTVEGLPDSTWLYADFSLPGDPKDSVRIIHGKFTLTGTLPEKTASVYLHTAGYKDYLMFWVENTKMTLTLKSGEFKKGIIKGSPSQDLFRQLQDKEEQAGNDQEKVKQIDRDFIRKYPNSLVSANLLNIYASTWGKDSAEALYNNLNPEMKASRTGLEIKEFIALNKQLKTGDRYVDFEQLNTVGNTVRLSDIKAKYVLLDFWASWCGPCRGENPNLVKTYSKFKDKGFAVLGVSLDDDKTQWLKAVKDDNLAWENVSELKGFRNKAALIYGIYFIPNNFLIDQSGSIIATNLRGEELDQKLQQLLP